MEAPVLDFQECFRLAQNAHHNEVRLLTAELTRLRAKLQRLGYVEEADPQADEDIKIDILPEPETTGTANQRLSPMSGGPRLHELLPLPSPASVASLARSNSSLAGGYRLNEAWAGALAVVLDALYSRASDDAVRYRYTPFSVAHKEEVHQSYWMVHKSMLATETGWLVPLPPQCAVRIAWDVLSTLALVTEAIIVPLQAFTAHGLLGEADKVLGWILRFIWTVDIPLTFLTGVYGNDGQVHLSFCYVARRYAASWLGFDLLLVLMNWMPLLDATNAGLESPTLGRLVRFTRVLRMMRLARVAKVPQIMKSFSEKVMTEENIVRLGILQSISALCILCHIFACLWYYVGQECAYEGNQNWLEKHGYEGKPFGIQYLGALHWSFANFMNNEPNMMAYSVAERIYSIITVLLAFLCSSIFVAATTTSMMSSEMLGSSTKVQLWKLRQYLRYHSVSTPLAVLVMRSVKRSVSLKQNNVLEEDIEYLQYMSRPLMLELHTEIHGRILHSHPLFHEYFYLCGDVMRRLCHDCVKVWHASAGQVVFWNKKSEAHPSTIFVKDGIVEYNETAVSGAKICEVVLWVDRWRHKGTLQAKNESTLVMVDAHKFQTTMQACTSHCGDADDASALILLYARYFVDMLNKLELDELTDLDEGIAHASWARITNAVSSTSLGGTTDIESTGETVGEELCVPESETLTEI